jgi:NTE family protein
MPLEDTPSVASTMTSCPENMARRSIADPGPALCLSGGGFRATLFHLGALIRLNELGVLSRVRVITSVSGGSILNGALASRWSDLQPNSSGVFTNFEIVTTEVRKFCSDDLRTSVLIGRRLNPRYGLELIRNRGVVSADALVEPYSKLMLRKRLDELPDPAQGGPRFIFCATSVQTGACWHFHGGPQARMGDFYTGYFDVGSTTVSQAVAASSAFPPGFGGLRLSPPGPPDRVDPWGLVRRPSPKPGRLAPAEAGKRVLLTDGGVYDNLAVEPVWELCRTLIVSDAGHPFSSVGNVSQALVSRLRRAVDISAEQVGAVRKRWMIERIQLGTWLGSVSEELPDLPGIPGEPAVRSGTIWAIDTPPENYPHEPRAPVSTYEREVLDLLASTRTDLNAFTKGEQGCLQNHGYWLADAGVRHYVPSLPTQPQAEFQWPDPAWAPGTRAATAALADSRNRRIARDFFRWALRRRARRSPA